jgi:hypothetical protein
MHIIIGIISALASLYGLLNLLKMLGVEIHPFTWIRRLFDGLFKRTSRSNANINPADLSDTGSSLDAVVIAMMMIVGVLKLEGEISQKQKLAVIGVLKKEFHLNDQHAAGAINSSLAGLANEASFEQFLSNVLSPGHACFSREQTLSLVATLRMLTTLNGPSSAAQKNVIDLIEHHLV